MKKGMFGAHLAKRSQKQNFLTFCSVFKMPLFNFTKRALGTDASILTPYSAFTVFTNSQTSP